ncbi:MAG TPA: site-specific integrase [Bryobacteraceae bacterium]|nr:site-specific integrase [Bryobacteraceae bacterium]
MEVGSRRILHAKVTTHPTAEWTTQQFREFLAFDHPYRFVVHDRDAIFSSGLDAALKEFGVSVPPPIALVRVKGGTKREVQPRVLETGEFQRLAARIGEPYRTMVLVAGCLGLRVSEIVGLQWGDFDMENRTVLVQRGIVHGRVGAVKTECSKSLMSVDPLLMGALLQHKKRCYPTPEGWLFANPATGRPYHQDQIVKTHMKTAATAAEIPGKVGWHTFRHSYRSWLDSAGASMTVQKELMRHASIQTTMNVYGRAMSDGKRRPTRTS